MPWTSHKGDGDLLVVDVVDGCVNVMEVAELVQMDMGSDVICVGENVGT